MIDKIRTKLNEFLNNPGFKKYFFNTGWLMVDQVLKLILALVIGIWVARYLGPENFGILTFASGFVGLFAPFSKLGLGSIVVRNILNEKEDKNTILGTAFFLKFCASVLTIIAVYVGLQLTSTTDFEKLITMVVAVGIVILSFDVVGMFFESQVKAKYSGLSSSISIFGSSLVRITLVMFKASLLWFAFAVLLERLIKAVSFLTYYAKMGESIRNWKVSRASVKGLLKDGWPMILAALAVSFYMKFDQVMVREMIGNEAVGYYGVAVRLSEIWLFICVAITKSLYPAVIKAKSIGQNEYHKRLMQLYKLLFLIALGISVFITLFASFIITFLFGEEYSRAIPVLTIYVWSTIFVFLNNGASQWYITENLQHILTVRLFVGAVANFFLNLLLINLYGLEGAAIATLISYSIASYFGNLFFKKTRIVFKMQTKAMINLLKLKIY